jgi:quinol monooxygenase YgiN
MSKIAAVATLTAKPGKRDELVNALLEMIDTAEGESGTEVYALHVANDEPEVVRFYELYADKAALDVHRHSDGMKAMGPKLAGLLDGPPVVNRMTPVRAKGIAF